MNIKNFYMLQTKSHFYTSETLDYAAGYTTIYAPQRLQSKNAVSFAFLFRFTELYHTLGHKT